MTIYSEFMAKQAKKEKETKVSEDVNKKHKDWLKAYQVVRTAKQHRGRDLKVYLLEVGLISETVSAAEYKVVNSKGDVVLKTDFFKNKDAKKVKDLNSYVLEVNAKIRALDAKVINRLQK